MIDKLNHVLNNLKIKAECVNFIENDGYSSYDIRLLSKTRIRDIERFSDEIALHLKISKPVITTIPEQGIVRLECYKSNIKSDIFDLFKDNKPAGGLECLIGKSMTGENLWFDLSKCPHLLVAGTTGSGKSTAIHSIIANLLQFHNCKLYLVDPKNMEFYNYEQINRDLFVYYDYQSAINMLDKLIDIMEFRFSMMRKESIDDVPYIVVVIDEFADLILQDKDKQFYNKLCKLAQKCRAAKIHIVLSTQRPSADIISGAIKANFPARIVCKTASKVDSRIILDCNGAENLLGKGDAYLKIDDEIKRFQVSYSCAKDICAGIKK